MRDRAITVAEGVVGERLYGLDWLRIGAFGLLIFYHIGMFFVGWDWHIKSPQPLPWLEHLMRALNPWRLSLLFLISGTASAFLLAKTSGSGRFAASRSTRLLIPLAAGMILFVPPQPWVELTVQHGYRPSFGHFWLNDYFRFGALEGIVLPTWQHLWFVAYLWTYTIALALAAAVSPGTARAALLRWSEIILGSWRVLLVPIVVLWGLRMTLFPIFDETHALVDDWYNHASYGFVFAVGLVVAHSAVIREAFIRFRIAALLLAVIGYAGLIAYNLAYPEGGAEPNPAVIALARFARACEAWGAIAALVGFALDWKGGDSAARRYLTEAIFPYYIAHQTIIVLTAFWLLPLGLGNGPMFAILVIATVLGCAVAHEVARRTGLLRPLFGLSSAPLKSRSKSQPAVAH